MNFRSIRTVCTQLIRIAPLCCAVCFICILGISYAAGYFRAADQLCHFKAHIFWCSVVLFIASCFIRKYRKTTLLLFVPILIITALETIPWYIPLKNDNKETASFRVCLVNVLRRNTQYHAVQKFVADIDPDIMVLMETDCGWTNALRHYFNEYPYSIVSSELGNAGFGICGTYLAPAAVIIGIPIDHVLFSDHFRCTKFKKGPYIGSDHLPVWADISIPQL